MATIKDVARESGLAVGTVSRVLNNRGYISEKTRQKVMDAIDRLDYQPNEAARLLQKKKADMIGVIVPKIDHPYFSTLISHLTAAAYRQGCRILVLDSQGLDSRENEQLDLCSRNQVRGIILCNGNLDLKKVQGIQVPVITIERKKQPGDTAIECDNELGGRLAAEHLIDRGCRHLLFIGGVTDSIMPGDMRRQGFLTACRMHGADVKDIFVSLDHYVMKEAQDAFEQLLDENPDTDGIFLSDDMMAAQMLQVCSLRGIRIPQELKIVGFDDTMLASLVSPPLTTIRQPIRDMAEKAVDLIMEAEKGYPSPEKMVFPVTLIARDTT